MGSWKRLGKVKVWALWIRTTGLFSRTCCCPALTTIFNSSMLTPQCWWRRFTGWTNKPIVWEQTLSSWPARNGCIGSSVSLAGQTWREINLLRLGKHSNQINNWLMKPMSCWDFLSVGVGSSLRGHTKYRTPKSWVVTLVSLTALDKMGAWPAEVQVLGKPFAAKRGHR